MVEDKYIGVALALSSSIFIGTSFVVTKKGLIHAAKSSAIDGMTSGPTSPATTMPPSLPLSSSSSSAATRCMPSWLRLPPLTCAYLRRPLWWLGLTLLAIGEALNFVSYAFASTVLVAPLGALSVFISAVLASIFLNERLHSEGKVGCALCLIGAVIIVLHSPQDKVVDTIDVILGYAIRPGFLCYFLFVTAFCVFMIWKVAPRYGNRNVLVYISICSFIGSITVIACKGFGIALKLTFGGNSQLTHPSTYFFGALVIMCVLVQLHYLNKALAIFSTAIVTPVYYVFFTSASIIASVILFEGFGDSTPLHMVTVLCGFLTILAGVYLLQSPKLAPSGEDGQFIPLTEESSMNSGSNQLDIIKSNGPSIMSPVPSEVIHFKSDVAKNPSQQRNGVMNSYSSSVQNSSYNSICLPKSFHSTSGYQKHSCDLTESTTSQLLENPSMASLLAYSLTGGIVAGTEIARASASFDGHHHSQSVPMITAYRSPLL